MNHSLATKFIENIEIVYLDLLILKYYLNRFKKFKMNINVDKNVNF